MAKNFLKVKILYDCNNFKTLPCNTGWNNIRQKISRYKYDCHTILASCNNVALPYFTFWYLPISNFFKIGDGYIIAAIYLHVQCIMLVWGHDCNCKLYHLEATWLAKLKLHIIYYICTNFNYSLPFSEDLSTYSMMLAGSVMVRSAVSSWRTGTCAPSGLSLTYQGWLCCPENKLTRRGVKLSSFSNRESKTFLLKRKIQRKYTCYFSQVWSNEK